MNAVNRDLLSVFPDSDYRHRIGLEQGTIAGFFGRTPEGARTLDERRKWIDSHPDETIAFIPEGRTLAEEAASLLRAEGVIDGPLTFAPGDPPHDFLAALGRELEPDYLLLNRAGAGPLRLLAGCVCFPSSWTLVEKIGRPLEEIHDVVPGLNAQLGPAVNSFLGKLSPGTAWLRSNWGLSRSPELNQHPLRNLPRLEATVDLEEVWLRIERQALVRLPATGGVLFGIRIAVYPLAEVKRDTEVVSRLHRALQTMPEAMAVYKNLVNARPKLLELLA